jgi:hypothetical protein
MRRWLGVLAAMGLAGCATGPVEAWTHGQAGPVATACLWSALDGCSVAPAIAMPVQLGNFFPTGGATTGGAGQQSPQVPSGQLWTQGRPPFAVPAVDYAVGIYTPVASLTDVYAASVAHTLPTGCALTGSQLFCNGSGALSLIGYRFDNPTGAGGYGGYQLKIDCTNMTSVLLDDDYLISAMPWAATTANLSFTYELTGTCNSLVSHRVKSTTVFGNAAALEAALGLGNQVSMVRDVHTGTNTTTYDYDDISQVQQKGVQLAGTGDVTITHSAMRDIEFSASAGTLAASQGYHGDGWWFNSNQPGVSNLTVEYNTCFQGATEVYDAAYTSGGAVSCFILNNLNSTTPWNVPGKIKFDHNLTVANVVPRSTTGVVMGANGSLASIGYSSANTGVINEVDISDNWTDPTGSTDCIQMAQTITTVNWGTGPDVNVNLTSPIPISSTAGSACANHH